MISKKGSLFILSCWMQGIRYTEKISPKKNRWQFRFQRENRYSKQKHKSLGCFYYDWKKPSLNPEGHDKSLKTLLFGYPYKSTSTLRNGIPSKNRNVKSRSPHWSSINPTSNDENSLCLNSFTLVAGNPSTLRDTNSCIMAIAHQRNPRVKSPLGNHCHIDRSNSHS